MKRKSISTITRDVIPALLLEPNRVYRRSAQTIKDISRQTDDLINKLNKMVQAPPFCNWRKYKEHDPL